MSDKPSSFQAFLDFARTPVGMIMLLTLWPSLLGLIGLPTGAAEKALQMYQGAPAESVPCTPAPAPDASSPEAASPVEGPVEAAPAMAPAVGETLTPEAAPGEPTAPAAVPAVP